MNPRADLVAKDGARIHDLKNTLASLRLRLGLVATDPTCRWAQEANLDALVRITDEALDMVRGLDRSEPARTPVGRTGRSTARRRRS